MFSGVRAPWRREGGGGYGKLAPRGQGIRAGALALLRGRGVLAVGATGVAIVWGVLQRALARKATTLPLWRQTSGARPPFVVGARGDVAGAASMEEGLSVLILWSLEPTSHIPSEAPTSAGTWVLTQRSQRSW